MDKIELSIKDLNDIEIFTNGKYSMNPNENDLAMNEFELNITKFNMNIINIMSDETTIYRYDKNIKRLFIKNTKRMYAHDKTHIELSHLEFQYENNSWIFDIKKFKVAFDGIERPEYTRDYLEPLEINDETGKIYSSEKNIYAKEFLYLNKFIMDYKPIIIVEDKEEHIHTQSKKKHKKSRSTYRVNLYKVIHLKKDWQTEIKKHIEFTCLAWRVRGHYRTYKSGRKVYIQPYTKGKNKNDLSSVVDKTYYIKKGE